jgi:hypothetical protein
MGIVEVCRSSLLSFDLYAWICCKEGNLKAMIATLQDLMHMSICYWWKFVEVRLSFDLYAWICCKEGNFNAIIATLEDLML